MLRVERDPFCELLFFIFENPGRYGFWMKDMLFPLDIVWIDANKTVIGIEKNLSPETYPNVYTPVSSISYALELNAGSAQEFGLKPGTQLRFDTSSSR